MISHKYKYIFVHIPKCGGSSIEQTLLKAEGVNVQNLDGFYINHLNDGVKKEHLLDYPTHAYSQHYSISQYDSTLSGSYYSFSFVRNPWDLIVSEYFYISDNYDFNFSFNEFVRMGEEIKKIEKFNWLVERGHHLKPQSSLLSDDINYIGRFENLQKDFDFVCLELGIPKKELPIINQSKRNHYRKYYNKETREIVAQRYAMDIGRFNYMY